MLETRPCHYGVRAILTLVLMTLPTITFAAETDNASPPRENLARNCSYSFSLKPNYALCTNASDQTDLTDGQTTAGQIWINDGTVGWKSNKPVSITLDLGQAQSIGEVALHSAGGSAGVGWPRAVAVLVSEDGETYHQLTELTSGGEPAPPYDSLMARDHRFAVDGLNGRGRYLQFVLVPSGEMTFADEIEVYANPNPDATAVDNGPVVTLDDLMAPDYLTRLGLQRRLQNDLNTVVASMSVELRHAEAQTILSMRQRIKSQSDATSMPQLNHGYPLNDLHREIFTLHGRSLETQGVAPLALWQTYRYATLDPFAPPTGGTPGIDLAMLPGERRSEVINLTNATDEPRAITLYFDNLPGGATPNDVTLSRVLFTDSPESGTHATALLPVEPTAEGYQTTIPAGMTQQFWITFKPTLQLVGAHKGSLKIKASATDQAQSVPVWLTVGATPLASSDMSMTLWDYISEEARAITPANKSQSIATMKSAGINVPAMTYRIMPTPAPEDFNEAGELIKPLDFEKFDAFLATWPDAKKYLVFVHASPKHAFGAKAGTPRFDKVVGSWATAWANHLREKGIDDGRVMLLFVDEPHTPEQWLTTLRWARATKAATNAFDLIVDPVRPYPPNVEHAVEALKYFDIVCPTWGHYNRGGEREQNFYNKIAEDPDKQLWLYSCSGPVLWFNPAYFRMQTWQAYSVGAKGSCFWAFCDARTKNAWNPYVAWGSGFSPVYLAPDSVTHTKHWEALQEGMQDVALFQQWAAKSSNETVRSQAAAVLDQAFDRNEYFWAAPDEMQVLRDADAMRRAVIQAMMQ